MDHLTHQRNDAVDSTDDCRRKFVDRTLFRKLARQGRLASPLYDTGPFKLWCDDLRPSNVLLNAILQIVGVVDWEFTYAAPAEFSFAPPWWLLLEQPEYWPGGLDAWTHAYESRLQIFLNVLREREDAVMNLGRLKEDQRVSGKMQESWRQGDFWVELCGPEEFCL